MRKLIVQESSEKVYDFIANYADSCFSKTLVLSTTTRFNVEKQPLDVFETIINLKRLNDVRRINKFLESVNEKLPDNGLFIGCVDTNRLRKMRILKKNPPVLNYIIYSFDFLYRRVMPKLKLTKRLYFSITRGNNRLLSKAEAYGRLYSCGFELSHEERIGEWQYFVAKKVKEPAFDYNPTYGMFIKLKRVGKNGKIIRVYKMRTMHPYSEYLQAYIFSKNNLQDGGKIANDFRVNTVGRFMRKFWLDELPMLYNLLKGDLKLVGVRPLSQHYYNLYSEDLKEKRIKYKPGLIPPFYVDLPKTLEEIMESERKYLELYEKHPLRTDFSYFFSAFNNIVFKKARSK